MNVVSAKFISSRHRLHRFTRQAAAVEENGELVASKEVVGEDVEMQVPV